MSYWIKKQNPNIKPIQCLGKKSNGNRCENKIYSLKDKRHPLCHVHNDQNVTFKYGPIRDVFKDVAGLIAKHINDSDTFYNFSQVSRSSAKACHLLQIQKMIEFRRRVTTHSGMIWILPNSAIVDDECELTGKVHVDYKKIKENYERRVREINESKQYYRELHAERKRQRINK